MKRFLLLFLLTITIYAPSKAQLAMSGLPPSCNGFCNGYARIINQGGNQYHYLWNTGDTVYGISNLCGGNYQCIVSNSQYVVLDTFNISLPAPPTLNIAPIAVKNVLCYGHNDGSVRITATGGTGDRYSFLWSDGYQGTLTDSTLFNLSAGTYSITITDINNCSASAGLTISQPLPINITPQIANASTCGVCNGSISAVASGGASVNFNYHWSTGATTASLTNLCAGTYMLTATDTSGCSAVTTLNLLASQSALNVSFSTATNIDCQHSTGFLFASVSGNTGPVHYLWSTGSNAPDIFGIPAGVYQVGVTDSAGCFAAATDTIKNLGIAINTVQKLDFNCEISAGAIIINPTQGNPPYAIHWSTGMTTGNISSLLPDTYTVTVTDQNNCTASKAYTISQINNVVTLQTAGIDVSCQNLNNGLAYVTLSGASTPYTYQWNTLPAQSTDTALGLAVGAYTIKVTDSFGCTISGNVNIDSNYSQVTTTVSVGNCDSTGTAVANIQAGIAPYTYLWNSVPPQTTATADSLYIGVYTVSVTDSVGCTRVGSANIQYNCTGYITGTVFYDTNANCHLDNGENGIAGLTVLATNNDVTFSGVTNLSGQYTIPVNVAGQYQIITALNSSSAILQYGGAGCGYFEVCPASDTVTFTSLNTTFQNHNFGFVGSSDFDLAIQAGWTPTSGSHQKEYWILYTNYAFLTPFNDSATVTFNYDPGLTFQSGIPAPVNDVANHTLTWVVDSVPSPTYTWADRLRAFFTVSQSLPANYQLQNTFQIQPYAGDCDTINNSVYTHEIAGLPPSPVSKEVYPEGDIELADSVLTYTIHFQNTGTDTATVIKITDSLSYLLDPQSVVNIASSPLYNQFFIAPGAVLTWVFSPAGIPDSATNALASAGFISFKAKLKSGTQPGYTVQNKASVSFDSHSSIVTNTTANYISFPLSIAQLTDAQISVKVFPNPFSSIVTIMIDGINTSYTFELIDVTGRAVKKLDDITTNRFQIERGDITSGVYLYRISVNHKALAYGKLVVD